MSLAHSPIPPMLPDGLMQESEQNLSVSYLNLPLLLLNNCQFQVSGSGFFANAQNVLVTGGIFVQVSSSCRLNETIITITYILSARTTIFYPPILEKGI